MKYCHYISILIQFPATLVSKRFLYLHILATLVIFVSCGTGASETPKHAPNVLFIAIDDLNDWIGVLEGHPQARTPNIDRLAARGVLFTNAHTAAPACNPSRVAVMSGLLPSTSGVYRNNQPWRPILKEAVTLPQYFMTNGYNALGAGKIFHLTYPDPDSWDRYFPSKKRTTPKDPFPDNIPLNGIKSTPNFDWGAVDVDDHDMGDYKVASWVIKQLDSDHLKPFFLAAGIFRPHMPWYVPQNYFDHYPVDSVRLPPFLDNDLQDIPPAGTTIAISEGHHKAILDHDLWRKAVQGYLASIEFADAQVGRIITALDESKYNDNTIIVLWSDHGWHLGEKSHWRKFALWERATRVTFMIIAPKVAKMGGRSSQPVNLVDIYPTLLDLANLPAKDGLDGISLRPLLERPEAKWTRPSITTLDQGNHSIRDARWRYIRYADGSEELYDHQHDDNEWKNLANDILYADIKMRLSNWIPE